MMLKSQLEDKLTTIFKIEQELSQKIVFSIVESISTAINENDRVEITHCYYYTPYNHEN